MGGDAGSGVCYAVVHDEYEQSRLASLQVGESSAFVWALTRLTTGKCFSSVVPFYAHLSVSFLSFDSPFLSFTSRIYTSPHVHSRSRYLSV